MQAATAGATSALTPKAGAANKIKITSSVMLWTLKGSFEEKVQAAAAAGLQSVELVAEHLHWSDAEIRDKKKFVGSFGMAMDTIIATPNWTTRPVSMVNPAHREAFLEDVRSALVFAEKLEVPQIILMGGNEQPGMNHQQQFGSLVEGGKRAAELAAKSGPTLIFEPLNSKVDHKGYFLTTCVEGLRLTKEIDNPHFKLLFDVYHEQVQVGNVIRMLKAAIPHVAVFHVADNPGRNDPGTGEMNWPNIYKAIAKAGYSGYICMEYLPLGDQTASLKKSVDEMRANLAT